MTQKTAVISSIEFIRTAKLPNGVFMINGQSKNPLWVNPGFMKQVYSKSGLSTETPFQQFLGSTLGYQELEITNEMLQAGGGKHVVISPLTQREIEFKQAGKRNFDFQLLSMSSALQQSIFSIGVKVDNSWASTTQPTMAVQATPVNTPAPTVDMNNQEEAEVLEEDVTGEDLGENS